MLLTDAHKLNIVFEIVEKAAIAKLRCPTNYDLRVAFRERGLMQPTDPTKTWNTLLPPGALVALAQAGRIQVEVYGRNWRVIEILTGKNRGCRTQEAPTGGEPYKIFTTRKLMRS